VNEREDGSGGSDAQGQREHRCQREDRGEAQLAKCVGDVLAQSLHGGIYAQGKRQVPKIVKSFAKSI
jgi:hypothetical protein